MADAVAVKQMINTDTHVGYRFTNLSDGTGETDVTKITKSSLKATDGVAPDSVDIWRVRWCIQKIDYVKLSWDHTADDIAMILSGNGYDDFDGLIPDRRDPVPNADPRSTGGTGNLLLTTGGAASGGSYDITIWLKKAST